MNTKEQASQLRLAAGILETGHPFETAPKPHGLWAKPMPHERDIMKWPLDKWEVRLTLAEPPDGRVLHNPDNLTAEQVGVGYRLLLADEVDNKQHEGSEFFSNYNKRGWGAGIWRWDTSSTIRLPLSVPWPEPEPEPEPFQLPPPPPGIEWHCKDGWKKDDLPQGYRPLVAHEIINEVDEINWGSGNWCLMDGLVGTVVCGDELTRTTRPLTFTHLGKTWTWHNAGDPMPCDGDRSVNYLMRDLGAATTKFAKDLRWSPATKSECAEADIIGWRYAETEPATKTVDLGPEDVPPGSVLRLNTWGVGIYVTPSVWHSSVSFATAESVTKRTYGDLRVEGWRINRPANRDANGNPTKWEPCHKQIPA